MKCMCTEYGREEGKHLCFFIQTKLNVENNIELFSHLAFRSKEYQKIEFL